MNIRHCYNIIIIIIIMIIIIIVTITIVVGIIITTCAHCFIFRRL